MAPVAVLGGRGPWSEEPGGFGSFVATAGTEQGSRGGEGRAPLDRPGGIRWGVGEDLPGTGFAPSGWPAEQVTWS